jgi:hypothetical protein
MQLEWSLFISFVVAIQYTFIMVVIVKVKSLSIEMNLYPIPILLHPTTIPLLSVPPFTLCIRLIRYRRVKRVLRRGRGSLSLPCIEVLQMCRAGRWNMRWSKDRGGRGWWPLCTLPHQLCISRLCIVTVGKQTYSHTRRYFLSFWFLHQPLYPQFIPSLLCSSSRT